MSTYYTPKSSLIGNGFDEPNDVLDGTVTVVENTKFDGDIIPSLHCLHDLGSLTNFWQNVFACQVHVGDFDYKMLQEGAGNIQALYWDTLSHLKYNRSSKSLKINIDGGQALEIKEFLGANEISTNGTLFIDDIQEFSGNHGVLIENVLSNDGDLSLGSSSSVLYLGSSKFIQNHSSNGSTSIGIGSYDFTTTGGYGMTVYGYQSAKLAIAGVSRCVSIGTRSMASLFGNSNSLINNVCIGFECAKNGQNFDNCTYVGSNVATNATGDRNSCFGMGSGAGLTSGVENCFYGLNSGVGATTNTKCVTIGTFANVSAGITESTAIGHESVTTANYQIRLGKNVDANTGELLFRTQSVHHENFIDNTVGLIVNDQLGSNSKEGLYTSHEYINTFGNGTDVSTSCRIRFRRVGDSVSVVVEGFSIIPTVLDTQVFGDVLHVNYRPAYHLIFPIKCVDNGGTSFKQIKITTAGSISVSELSSTSLDTELNIFSPTGFSYAL